MTGQIRTGGHKKVEGTRGLPVQYKLGNLKPSQVGGGGHEGGGGQEGGGMSDALQQKGAISTHRAHTGGSPKVPLIGVGCW